MNYAAIFSWYSKVSFRNFIVLAVFDWASLKKNSNYLKTLKENRCLISNIYENTFWLSRGQKTLRIDRFLESSNNTKDKKFMYHFIA